MLELEPSLSQRELDRYCLKPRFPILKSTFLCPQRYLQWVIEGAMLDRQFLRDGCCLRAWHLPSCWIFDGLWCWNEGDGSFRLSAGTQMCISTLQMANASLMPANPAPVAQALRPAAADPSACNVNSHRATQVLPPALVVQVGTWGSSECCGGWAHCAQAEAVQSFGGLFCRSIYLCVCIYMVMCEMTKCTQWKPLQKQNTESMLNLWNIFGHLN